MATLYQMGGKKKSNAEKAVQGGPEDGLGWGTGQLLLMFCCCGKGANLESMEEGRS